MKIQNQELTVKMTAMLPGSLAPAVPVTGSVPSLSPE